MTSHLDELSCLRYLDGQLASDGAQAVETHITECSRCRDLLQALERETRLLHESLTEADEETPARLLPTPSEDLSWVTLGVVGLAALGVYAFWTSVVLPWWERLQSVGMGGETLAALVVFRGVFWEGWSTMIQNLIRAGTILAAAAAVVSIARWSWRHLRAPVAVLAALGFALASSGEAAVIETDRTTYVLEKDRVVDNDLIVAAETVRIEGTVDGDLIACGQTVIVTGHVMGDVIAFCQRLQVEGQVDGNVRSGSEFLDLRGRVGRNVTSAAETVELPSDAAIEGSLTLGAERAVIGGSTRRDLLVAADTTELHGRIGGGALVATSRLTIGPSAEIAGRARLYGSQAPDVSSQAKLASPLEIEKIEETPKYASPETYVNAILSWAAAFVLGLAVFLLAPRLFTSVDRNISRYGISILLGAAALVITPVLAVLACITLVGLPLGLSALFLYALALYGAQVLVGAWIGREILGPSVSRGQTIGRLALGLALLHAIGFVPYVGKVVTLAVALWGLGALVLAGARRSHPATAAP